MPGETRPPKRAMSARHLACPPAATRAQATRVVLTQPRSGMTRNGSAFALPTPEPRTAGTVSCSSPSGPAQPHGSRLLPGPVAGNYGDRASLPARQARRDRQKQPGRNGNGTGSPLPAAIALLPTPMAGDFGADRSARPGPAFGGRTADRPARPGRCDHLSGHRSGPAGSQAATRTSDPATTAQTCTLAVGVSPPGSPAGLTCTSTSPPHAAGCCLGRNKAVNCPPRLGSVDRQLPAGAAGPHPDLEPAAPDDRAAGVRGLLQHSPAPPNPEPGRAAAPATRWHRRPGSVPGSAA